MNDQILQDDGSVLTTSPFATKASNLPNYMAVKDVQTMFSKITGLESSRFSCRKNLKWNHAFINLKDEATYQTVLQQYSEFEWKGKKIQLEPHRRTQSLRERNECNKEKEPFSIEKLYDQVTPYWRKNYEEQLECKKKDIKKALRKYWNDAIKWGFGYKEIKETIPSPVQNAYRNKCEFAVGRNHEGRPTVGFSMGLFREGEIAIEDPTGCLHLSMPTKQVVEAFQKVLDESPHPPYDRLSKSGVWRLLTVRHQSTDELMVIVQIHPQQLVEEELALIRTALKDAFGHPLCLGDSSSVSVTSLYLQRSTRFAQGWDEQASNELLLGSATVKEKLNGLQFAISPSSFFQVNTLGAGLLYEKVKELAFSDSAEPAVILDLCCGTGTIGMILSRSPLCEQVIGVELVESAVSDAISNAASNGIANCAFKCGKVEDLVDSVIKSVPPHKKIIVVLDPPRAGAHLDVIKVIRNRERISRVVYVSCNPAGALNNFLAMSRPISKQYQGPPFAISTGAIVDLFPHTNHCELVLQFDRISAQ